ncbi:MAG TPA: hypothetical protein VJX92_01385 [Methylomirabilota bacterium]|nr:hypothetical protein [Methylomirabilota bacterium]
MDDGSTLIDTIFLMGGFVLIVVTSLRMSRRRSQRKRTEGQSAATIGILMWLGLFGVALYLIFG